MASESFGGNQKEDFQELIEYPPNMAVECKESVDETCMEKRSTDQSAILAESLSRQRVSRGRSYHSKLTESLNKPKEMFLYKEVYVYEDLGSRKIASEISGGNKKQDIQEIGESPCHMTVESKGNVDEKCNEEKSTDHSAMQAESLSAQRVSRGRSYQWKLNRMLNKPKKRLIHDLVYAYKDSGTTEIASEISGGNKKQDIQEIGESPCHMTVESKGNVDEKCNEEKSTDHSAMQAESSSAQRVSRGRSYQWKLNRMLNKPKKRLIHDLVYAYKDSGTTEIASEISGGNKKQDIQEIGESPCHMTVESKGNVDEKCNEEKSTDHSAMQAESSSAQRVSRGRSYQWKLNRMLNKPKKRLIHDLVYAYKDSGTTEIASESSGGNQKQDIKELNESPHTAVESEERINEKCMEKQSTNDQSAMQAQSSNAGRVSRGRSYQWKVSRMLNKPKRRLIHDQVNTYENSGTGGASGSQERSIVTHRHTTEISRNVQDGTQVASSRVRQVIKKKKYKIMKKKFGDKAKTVVHDVVEEKLHSKAKIAVDVVEQKLSKKAKRVVRDVVDQVMPRQSIRLASKQLVKQLMLRKSDRLASKPVVKQVCLDDPTD